MLCCLAEVGCFVFGIVTLVKGKFTLTANKVVSGAPARVIGGLLLLPLLIGQGGGAIYGLIWGIRQGAKGAQVDFAQAARELETPALIINIVGTAVPLLLALIIGLVNAKPAAPKRRFDEFEDDEEDYRRPRHDEE
jgi:hypothetical protein